MTPRVSNHQNIIDILSARSDVDTLAYVFLAEGTSKSEIRWTFADTAAKSNAFAAHLDGLGLRAGDRVVLAVNPSLEYIAALYGIMQLGAIPVPCFPPLRTKELDRFQAIALDCEPKGIIVDEMYRQPIEALQSRLASCGLAPTVVYTEQMTVGHETVPPVPTTPNDIALIQYTSGSTAAPKGVCLTHRNLLSNCEVLGRNMGVDPDRIGFSWLPPYHDMGLMGTILVSMFQGVPLVMMSPMHFIQHPLGWLKAISDYRATITVGPNFSLDLCSDALLDETPEGLDLSSLQRLYCGAEPINPDTLARFEQLTAPLGLDPKAVTPCYGMAETTLYIAGKNPSADYRTADPPPGSVTGRGVVSCGEVDNQHVVRIADPATRNSVHDGVVGEIWVTGPSVASGYYNQAERTRETFHARLADEDGEYLRTGDLGFLRSGELFVTGRMKDMIIVNGRNIYPQDVEANVRAHPAFRAAAAVSIPGEDTEQLCVVAEVGQEMTAQLYSQLVEEIRFNVISEFGVGPQIHLSPKRSIPTTTSGKVRRQETRRMLLANELPSVHIDTTVIEECTT
jgi:acyl-CoA synthetase (AMP-forming)/AMP-acid ligase II